ncbi:hypothetical protein YERSI8AC_170045 [Enterobacterales bacterium 8AC]|nr:hypothetical protein YERSI8AC_170045 [Enterobacterales bacterium 8AC]
MFGRGGKHHCLDPEVGFIVGFVMKAPELVLPSVRGNPIIPVSVSRVLEGATR